MGNMLVNKKEYLRQLKEQVKNSRGNKIKTVNREL
jgi:hypothetical protein